MTQFKIHNQVLIQLLRITAERETMDYIIQEMKQDLDDDMPAEELVRAFAKAPDKPTKLPDALRSGPLSISEAGWDRQLGG